MDETEQLQSPDVQQRAAAAEALSLMGPDAGAAAVELVNACADQEAVREWAVAALEELGPPAAESLERLTALVHADNPLVAYWAITLLGRSESAARSSQDDLAAVLTTSTTINVRERAAWALGKIDANSPTATAALKEAASSSEARLSRIAKAALEQTQA